MAIRALAAVLVVISHRGTWGSHWCLWDSFLFSAKQRFALADRQSHTSTDVLPHGQRCLGAEDTEGTNEESVNRYLDATTCSRQVHVPAREHGLSIPLR